MKDIMGKYSQTWTTEPVNMFLERASFWFQSGSMSQNLRTLNDELWRKYVDQHLVRRSEVEFLRSLPMRPRLLAMSHMAADLSKSQLKEEEFLRPWISINCLILFNLYYLLFFEMAKAEIYRLWILFLLGTKFEYMRVQAFCVFNPRKSDAGHRLRFWLKLPASQAILEGFATVCVFVQYYKIL